MYCKYCGKEISEDSRFCRHCGKALEEVAPKGEKETKVFHSGFATNAKTLPMINEWLQQQAIEIDTISINTGRVQMIFVIEMAITRLELTYRRVQTDKRYTIKAFSGMASPFNPGFEKMDKEYEQWKRENPDKKVVWERRCSDGEAINTIYCLYV